ncbi:unnamed protein product [Cylicocyclus nassatus]|uniref:Uncharacterized protein n=1 Tax=Cylicocyclus nassatus TaxID=53992 RepID=A0AA36H6A7_CYLNA|nr:unnamed protein product [Cylicocyclus nassatus]
MLTVRQKIPTRVYLKIVIIFFVVNLCNNTAIKCDIYFPLFIIFKSSSLLANILFGLLLRGHSYTTRELFSAFVVTGGIVITTLASYEDKPSAASFTFDFLGIPPFFIGVALLSTALMLSAYLRVCEEEMYARYGKHAKESMFMVHTLSIPGYALLGGEITQAFQAANTTEPFSLFGYDLIVPTAWVYIVGICVLQYVCIDNVYRLTALTTSLNLLATLSIYSIFVVHSSFLLDHLCFRKSYSFSSGSRTFPSKLRSVTQLEKVKVFLVALSQCDVLH